MPTVSIVIPTYMEEKYIADTLTALSLQNTWPSIEIIISDYDPDGTKHTLSALKYLPNSIMKNVRVMGVNKGGIGYARHLGALGSKGQYIMSFDADARFSDNDSVRRMIAPLLSGQYVMTHCRNTLDRDVWTHNIQAKLNESGISIIGHETGLTMSRPAYMATGGYKDVKQSEAVFLTLDVTRRFGQGKIKFVSDVTVIASARRIVGSGGGIFSDNNYQNAYR